MSNSLRPARFFCRDTPGDYLELGGYQGDQVTLFVTEPNRGGGSYGVYLNRVQAAELGRRLAAWADSAPGQPTQLWEDL